METILITAGLLITGSVIALAMGHCSRPIPKRANRAKCSPTVPPFEQHLDFQRISSVGVRCGGDAFTVSLPLPDLDIPTYLLRFQTIEVEEVA